MGERSDQDYHGYGHRLDWARNQKPKSTVETPAEIENRHRSLEGMARNSSFLRGESVLRTQIPLFVQNPDGDYERSYSEILAHTTRNSETVALFTRAGIDPRDISCKSEFFPEAVNLEDLIDSVTRYRDRSDRSGNNDPIHHQGFTVNLSDDQFHVLKSHYPKS
jgi:hypothetical protein